MTSTMNAAPESPTRPVRDPRTFYRTTLAVIAPIPMLAMAINYLVQPLDGDATVSQLAAFDRAHPGRLGALEWLSAPFALLIIPAFIAVGLVTWSRSPRRTAAALALAVPGTALALTVNPPDTQFAIFANRFGLDPATFDDISDAWWNHPMVLIASLWFLSGIVIGLTLLGISMWREHEAPWWMALALIVGGATHPFIPGHVAQGVGLLLATLGFAGASVALLRRPNDEFLPAP